MEINDFLRNFSELFEETDSSKFKPVTRFRDIEEWSSLTALSVIAMVDEKYRIKLTGEDIRKSQTVEDIFNLVNAKK